jgi:hypothetical protein
MESFVEWQLNSLAILEISINFNIAGVGYDLNSDMGSIAIQLATDHVQ